MLTMRALLCSHSVLVHLIKLLLLLLLLLCNCKDLSLLLCNCKDLSLLLLCDRDTSAPYLGVGLWKLCSLQGFGLWNSWSLLGLFGVLTLQFVRGAHSFSQGVILSEAFSLVKLCLFSQAHLAANDFPSLGTRKESWLRGRGPLDKVLSPSEILFLIGFGNLINAWQKKGKHAS
ncbi:hypothetical protein HKD37_20G056083 [Glycine soja]